MTASRPVATMITTKASRHAHVFWLCCCLLLHRRCSCAIAHCPNHSATAASKDTSRAARALSICTEPVPSQYRADSVSRSGKYTITAAAGPAKLASLSLVSNLTLRAERPRAYLNSLRIHQSRDRSDKPRLYGGERCDQNTNDHRCSRRDAAG